MATIQQIEANRRNAQHSTGPRTEAGKSVSRFNALKFGFEAQSLVLPGEDPDKLAALAVDYHRQLNPAGPLEDYLVQSLVQADWMRRRYVLIETLAIRHRIANPQDPDEISLVAFTCPAAQQLARRLAAEQRNYFRALKELRRAQKERAEQEAEVEAGEAIQSPAHAPRPPAPDFSPAPGPQPPAPEIGFVPDFPVGQAVPPNAT